MKITRQNNQNDSFIPGLFQIAAQIENPAMPSGEQPALVVTEKEFAFLRSEAMKSMPATKACGWSFPFPIRK